MSPNGGGPAGVEAASTDAVPAADTVSISLDAVAAAGFTNPAPPTVCRSADPCGTRGIDSADSGRVGSAIRAFARLILVAWASPTTTRFGPRDW